MNVVCCIRSKTTRSRRTRRPPPKATPHTPSLARATNTPLPTSPPATSTTARGTTRTPRTRTPTRTKVKLKAPERPNPGGRTPPTRIQTTAFCTSISQSLTPATTAWTGFKKKSINVDYTTKFADDSVPSRTLSVNSIVQIFLSSILTGRRGLAPGTTGNLVQPTTRWSSPIVIVTEAAQATPPMRATRRRWGLRRRRQLERPTNLCSPLRDGVSVGCRENAFAICIWFCSCNKSSRG